MRPLASVAASLIPWLCFAGCAEPPLAERTAAVLTADATGPAFDAAPPERGHGRHTGTCGDGACTCEQCD